MEHETTLDFFDKVQAVTERILTDKKRRDAVKREKQKKKNALLDWVDAFIWAAGMVLLINQYLFQAYTIPSGSMIDTLLIKDHVFVNKMVYGPELLPGVAKLPSIFQPKRNDVIIFENPSYISRGPVFDIAQRIIYMLTISLVDIDKDESGEPKAHFLIKRAVGMPGDTIVFDKGEFRVKFGGETRFVAERSYKETQNWTHNISRQVNSADYPALEAAGRAAGWTDAGLTVPAYLTRASARTINYPDYLFHEQARLRAMRRLFPDDERYRALSSRLSLGWYIPEGRILPLGDNRDSSRDGRYFGPVRQKKVLGKGVVKYWPPKRMGVIR